MRVLTTTSLLFLLSGFSLLHASQPLVRPNSPFDSYGTISWEDEKARLDNFAIQLQHDKTLLGFILVSNKTKGCPGEAKARAVRAKRYLVDHRGVPWNRVLWRLERYDEEVFTTLLLAPPGAYVSYPYRSFTTEQVDGPLTQACKRTLQRIKRSRW